jgi:hypothetical protein
MTTPRPARLRPALSEWATAVLRRCYPGQRPEDVIDQALRLKATADGHLTPDGRIKRRGGRTPGRQP